MDQHRSPTPRRDAEKRSREHHRCLPIFISASDELPVYAIALCTITGEGDKEVLHSVALRLAADSLKDLKQERA